MLNVSFLTPEKKKRSHTAVHMLTWYQHVFVSFIGAPHQPLPYGQANKLNQQQPLDFCIFFPKENPFYNSYQNFNFFFKIVASVKICTHKSTGRECLASSLWGSSNYTTKIPLALQCTIPPFGMGQPACTLLFFCYTLLPFCFYRGVLPWMPSILIFNFCKSRF